jgi:hypothetical protein
LKPNHNKKTSRNDVVSDVEVELTSTAELDGKPFEDEEPAEDESPQADDEDPDIPPHRNHKVCSSVVPCPFFTMYHI